MRILTFTSLFPDSTRPNFCIFIYQRMVHVARRPGNTVTVVAPVPYVPFWVPGKKAREYRSIPRQERFGDLKVYHPRYPFIPRISSALHGLLMFVGTCRLVSKLVRGGVDCIDAHFVYPDGFAAILLGKVLDIPVIVSARGTDMNFYPTIAMVRPMLRWTVRQANGLIGVCKALSSAMIDLGAPPERVHTIGNGVDPKRFHPANPLASREMLNVSTDRQVVVSVGALTYHKGQLSLIAAISELKRRGLSVQLYIAGEGSLRPRLEQQIRELALEQDVFLLGQIANEQLRFWYSAADVSCLASSREGWANVLLESMACGTPVVATRIWGTPEVVASEELGVLVEQTVSAIADGLQLALQKVWDRNRIAAYAHQRSWEVVAEQVERWLSQQAGIPKLATLSKEPAVAGARNDSSGK
jgi:teichuronic acid biosynthesis glycosyltransferase TuaC